MLSNEYIRVNRPLGDPAQGLYKLVLGGRLADLARPGQFVNIRIGETYDPLLRRPLSIAGIDRQSGEVTVYYRLKGQGTALLSHCAEGSLLDVLGPLGNGFSLAGMLNDPVPSLQEEEGELLYQPDVAVPPVNELILVAGGIGMFSLYALLEYMLRHPSLHRLPLTLIWGAQDQAFLEAAGVEILEQLPPERLLWATMDGSRGHQGLVTEPLTSYLVERLSERSGLSPKQKGSGQGARPIVAACGPNVMLEAVAACCADFSVASEVCLEEHMACGLGACLGCTFTVRDASGTLKRSRVCLDGPVFSGEEVVWHAGF